MSYDRGILSIFVGQAGVQIANSFWQLMTAEHSIDNSGQIRDTNLESENKSSFFTVVNNSRCVPRALLIDLEPVVIDEVRSGSYKKLFNPELLINSNEDSGGNFARGFFTVGRLIMPRIVDQLRRIFESEVSVSGIMVYRSLGGGTGAGLTSAIFDALVDLPKITKIEIPIYPSPLLSSSIVEPYNALLSEHFCMEEVELGLLFDNEAMFEICKEKLKLDKPTFSSINHLVCQTISCITANLRFQSVLNCDLNVLQTNLVPYPRIHFPIANIAPIMPPDLAVHSKLSISDITNSVFDSSNNLISLESRMGKYMSCSMFYRGTISPHQVSYALQSIKSRQNVQFVSWCPTGFKVSISYQSAVNIPRTQIAATKTSLAMLTNNSAVSYAWDRLNTKFQHLYSKKAFIHWFVGEGLEEVEFQEAEMNINALIRDYLEVTLEENGKVCESEQTTGIITGDTTTNTNTTSCTGSTSATTATATPVPITPRMSDYCASQINSKEINQRASCLSAKTSVEYAPIEVIENYKRIQTNSSIDLKTDNYNSEKPSSVKFDTKLSIKICDQVLDRLTIDSSGNRSYENKVSVNLSDEMFERINEENIGRSTIATNFYTALSMSENDQTNGSKESLSKSKSKSKSSIDSKRMSTTNSSNRKIIDDRSVASTYENSPTVATLGLVNLLENFRLRQKGDSSNDETTQNSYIPIKGRHDSRHFHWAIRNSEDQRLSLSGSRSKSRKSIDNNNNRGKFII